jgi:hypothetical protein
MRFSITTVLLRAQALQASSYVINPFDILAQEVADIKSKLPEGYNNTITGNSPFEGLEEKA